MKVLQPQELATLFRVIADSIESGDSLEGSIQYLLGSDGLEVEAALRTGNRDGQGGMLTI